MSKNQSDVLFELIDKLPEFSKTFLLGRAGEKTVGTRIGYARDFYAFLLFLQEKEIINKEPKDMNLQDLSKITAVDIDTYLTYMLETHSNNTVGRAKVSISAFFKYAENTLGSLDKNPVVGSGKVRLPKKDFVIYLTMEEQKRLISVIKTGEGLTEKQLTYHKRLVLRDLCIVTLFLDTGLRVSELVSLCMDDVDFTDYSIIVKRKRNRISKIFFSDETSSLLKEYVDSRITLNPLTSTGTDALFSTIDGEFLTVRAVEKLVKKYSDIAFPGKMGQISPHKLRSSFAMGFYDSTMDILTLQEKMGHDSLNTTNIYVKASRSKSKDLRNWKND